MTFPAPTGPRRRALLQAAALAAAPVAFAQSPAFPQRPVRIVVPYTPGGSNDVIARLVAQKLQEMWSQPVVVDNKPGAAGNIGTDFIARAAPDGYTIGIGNFAPLIFST